MQSQKSAKIILIKSKEFRFYEEISDIEGTIA